MDTVGAAPICINLSLAGTGHELVCMKELFIVKIMLCGFCATTFVLISVNDLYTTHLCM